MQPKPLQAISIHEALMYELESSWLAPRVSWRLGHVLLAKYFVWKVRRKHRRYIAWRELAGAGPRPAGQGAQLPER